MKVIKNNEEQNETKRIKIDGTKNYNYKLLILQSRPIKMRQQLIEGWWQLTRIHPTDGQ